MRISLNEIKKLVRIPEGVTDEELIERIGSRLVEIEEAIDLAPQYEGVYIIKVVKCEPIEGTHLHLCQIDAGEAGVKWAGEDDFVQVVCGAPNVHAGMLAVWITPGAIVPETYGNENFKLSVRKLQGHESYGMLAGADELGLDNEHKAIAEIDPKMARPGDCFADVFELDDIILDVENKSLTHRPDCFGLIGFAREVAGILGVKFEEPEWIGDKGEALASEDMVLNASQSSATKRRGSNEASATGVLSSSEKVARGSNEALATGALSLLSKDSGWSGSESLDEESSTHKDKNQLPKLFITIADPTLCPRYSCAVFDLANNEPSKFLTREAIFLAKAGMRAIDPLVDLTNIIMLQTGQPLHAFDYDKLVAVGGKDEAKIIVRGAKEGEELQLLDGETIKCISEDILITSNDVPVALAGAMGGKNTEIDASTKRVVLESATFSLYNLRKTQMAHGIFSEAITRFTKGQPAAMTLLVLGEAVRRAGVEPEIVKDEWGKESEPIVVKITTSAINQLLGTDHSTDEIVKTLENVGFKVSDYEQKFKKSKKLGPVEMVVEVKEKLDNELIIEAPAWRTDIHIAEDVIEEVGRLLGLDNISLDLPKKSFSGSEVAPMWQLKQELRRILSDRLGMHEILTYSFVSKDLLEKAGQDPENSYEITNSISPELQRFRQQIAPSVLSKVRENIKAGYNNFSLYELNQVTNRRGGLTDEGTPVMKTHLGAVELGDFYQLKAKILAMFRELHLPVEYQGLTSEAAKIYPYLEPKRSAEILVNGQRVGAFGELKLGVLKRFKLEQVVTALELELDGVIEVPRQLQVELKISKFPFVERDLTLKVASDAIFGRFDGCLRDILTQQKLIYTVSPMSIYQANSNDATKNISFHLRFSSAEKTLNQSEISDIMNNITMEVTKLGAEVI